MVEGTTITPGTETVLEQEQQNTPLVVTPAPVVLRYEYQPTDEQGRPIGGKQVIKYSTPEELATELTKQNVELIRKLRSETRKNRLGISEPESIGEAPRFQQPVSFSPKSLSAEEQYSLARDLGVDPEHFDVITDKLFEAKIGVKPSDLRQTLSDIQEERINARALAEANAFAAINPDFVRCNENIEAITNWMLRYELAPVKENFQKAYNTLKAAGILIENAPTEPTQEFVPSEPVVTPPAPVVAPPVEVLPTPEPTVSRVPLSLSRGNSEDTGTAPRVSGDDIVFEVVQGGQKRRFIGLAAIAAMPADEYRKRTISDPTFAKKEAALEKEAAERRKARR